MLLRLAAEYDKLGDLAAQRCQHLLRRIGREMLLTFLYLRSYLEPQVREIAVHKPHLGIGRQARGKLTFVSLPSARFRPFGHGKLKVRREERSTPPASVFKLLGTMELARRGSSSAHRRYCRGKLQARAKRVCGKST